MNRPLMRALTSIVIVAVACLSSTAAGEKGEWRSLFNGKTLEGWEQHGGEAVYSVQDGAVVGHSVPNTPNSFLCTTEWFRNFELVFEVQVDDALNSGVQIRSALKGNDRVYGPQVEIEASPGDAAYIYGEATGLGWLSQDRKQHELFKNGEWNTYRVVAKGANIKTWLNGEPIADLTHEAADTSGFIGLQVHGVGGRQEPLYVRWRNIKLRELD